MKSKSKNLTQCISIYSGWQVPPPTATILPSPLPTMESMCYPAEPLEEWKWRWTPAHAVSLHMQGHERDPNCAKIISESAIRVAKWEASPLASNVALCPQWMRQTLDGQAVAEAISIGDVERTTCEVMDSHLSLLTDISILDAQLALDLEHLRSRFFDLIHMWVAAQSVVGILKQIETYSMKRNQYRFYDIGVSPPKASSMVRRQSQPTLIHPIHRATS